jgi:phosphoenolpyruvate carboxylase
MNLSSPLLSTGLQKIDRDLQYLLDCFREVLHDLGLHDLAQNLPWTEAPNEYSNGGPPSFPPRAGQAFAIAFQMLNMVEENAAAQTRRARESSEGPFAEHGLWGHQLQFLQEQGLDEHQIAAGLTQVRVEPVLTAHPTEAKRLSVLEAHRALYGLLEKRENTSWTPYEQGEIREEVKAALERLWRSGEVLLSKPDVADERRNVLYFLREVFPSVLPALDARLRNAWQEAGCDMTLLDAPGRLPRLSFGTWVGGDRDGHPLVTAEVTQQTLDELRLNALRLVRRQLSQLVDNLGLSSSVQAPPPALLSAIARLESEVGERELDSERLNSTRFKSDEPWRRFAALMRAKLPIAGRSQPTFEYSNASESSFYRLASELRDDLQTLFDSLLEVGAARLAHAEVRPVQRSLGNFRFHLAVLDVRQNSAFHDIALDQLMTASGLEGSFSTRSEEERLRFLNNELRSPRPFLLLHGEENGGKTLSEEGDAVLSCYRVLARHRRRFGGDGLGALIVSMTRQLSDLLAVYALAREAGLAVNTPDGLVCKLPVVPLFETLDDLEGSAPMLRAWLEHPMTRRSLRAQSTDWPNIGAASYGRLFRFQQRQRNFRQPVGIAARASRNGASRTRMRCADSLLSWSRRNGVARRRANAPLS